MGYANNITRLCEVAFQAYARSIGLARTPSASIFAGFDEETIVCPRIVFNCDSAEPDGNPDDGNWACQLEVQCTSSRDDTSPNKHHTFASEVFSQLMVGRYTVPTLVTTAAGNAGIPFTVDDILPVQQAKATKDREAYSSMMFRVVGFGRNAAILSESSTDMMTEGFEQILP